MLADNSQNFDIKKVFNNLFEFALPDTAEILNYDYFVENEEQYLIAKFSFNEKDLEYIKSNFSNFKIALDSLSKITNDRTPLSYYSSKYTWWDLSELTGVVSLYHGFKTGVRIKSIPAWIFITKGLNDQYYLYVSHG